MLDHKCPQAVQFMGSKAMRFSNANRIEPKLCDVVSMFNMDVRRLRPFETVEEEAKTRRTQDGWHRSPSMSKVRVYPIRFNGSAAMPARSLGGKGYPFHLQRSLQSRAMVRRGQ
jgi:hypothetical protein